MSKLTINQRGSVKTVPAAHAKILIELGKATLVEDKPEPAETQPEPAQATPAKRTYKRKDMQAEVE